jgi:TfoX/Sxy family transcriptional regulator of competence genes
MAYNQQLAQRIHNILNQTPGIIEKKMFGGVCYMLDGNMACGVTGDRLIVRMTEAERETALKQPHVRVFDMTGRPMKKWVMVDAQGVAGDEDLRGWVEKGLAFARTLPPK